MLLSGIFAATSERRRASSAWRSASVNFGAGGVMRTAVGKSANAETGTSESEIIAIEKKVASFFILTTSETVMLDYYAEFRDKFQVGSGEVFGTTDAHR